MRLLTMVWTGFDQNLEQMMQKQMVLYLFCLLLKLFFACLNFWLIHHVAVIWSVLESFW